MSFDSKLIRKKDSKFGRVLATVLLGFIVVFFIYPSQAQKYEEKPKSTTTASAPPEFNKSWIVPDLGLEMAWIEPGSFTMGSPASEKNRDDDERQHQVSLTKGFWLGKYEVTQGEWETLMGNNPSRFFKSAEKRAPVEGVSWEEAMAFCRKLTERERSAGRLPRGYEYSLPTEAQWEYACRAGTRSAFSYGSSLSSRQANFEGNYPYGGASKGPYLKKTAPVGSYASNDWGLYDMHGNVWEWCYDWKGNYTMGTATDPAGPSSGSARVERGGSWNDYARSCRSALRGSSTPGARSILLGFRLALRAVP